MILNLAAGMTVAAFALFLIALAALCVFQRPRAERFLSKFASSAKAHFTEQILRMVAGVALILFSASMWFSAVFWLFGWLLVITSIGLLVLPWRWHREYASWAVPWVLRRIWLMAIGALALGAFIFYGISRAFV
jgi:hypothetical protein